MHDFVRRLEKIEPPNQLVAVIQDPLLQKFLQLRSSDVYAKRVDSWLLAFFEDQLEALAFLIESRNGILIITTQAKPAKQTYTKLWLSPDCEYAAPYFTVEEITALVKSHGQSEEKLATDLQLVIGQSLAAAMKPRDILKWYH